MITSKRVRPIPYGIQPSSNILSSENRLIVFDETSAASSYTTADDEYGLDMSDAGIQNSTVMITDVATETRDNIGAAWYAIATMMWLFATQGDGLCNYSIIASSIRRMVSGVAHEYLRQLLAACLDVLVVTYGVGFLLMYFYQCWVGVQ